MGETEAEGTRSEVGEAKAGKEVGVSGGSRKRILAMRPQMEGAHL